MQVLGGDWCFFLPFLSFLDILLPKSGFSPVNCWTCTRRAAKWFAAWRQNSWDKWFKANEGCYVINPTGLLTPRLMCSNTGAGGTSMRKFKFNGFSQRVFSFSSGREYKRAFILISLISILFGCPIQIPQPELINFEEYAVREDDVDLPSKLNVRKIPLHVGYQLDNTFKEEVSYVSGMGGGLFLYFPFLHSSRITVDYREIANKMAGETLGKLFKKVTDISTCKGPQENFSYIATLSTETPDTPTGVGVMVIIIPIVIEGSVHVKLQSVGKDPPDNFSFVADGISGKNTEDKDADQKTQDTRLPQALRAALDELGQQVIKMRDKLMSPPTSGSFPRIQVKLDRNVPYRPGDKVKVSVTAMNRGTNDFALMRGKIRSPHPVFEGLNLNFGALWAGQKQTRNVSVRIPANYRGGGIPLKITIYELNGHHSKDVKLVIPVRAPELPILSLGNKLKDDKTGGSRGKDDGAEMVYVPTGPGWFIAGSSSVGRYECDKKTWPVYLNGFYIDKYPVTNALFRAAGMTPDEDFGSKFNGASQPVVGVTWHQAKAYCEKVGKRLPTEPEWELAARGEEGRIYPWGNSWDASKLIHAGNSGKKTHPVDRKYNTHESPYGAVDMAGNVWEWLNDWYDAKSTRVIQGGSWGYADARRFQAAGRDRLYPHLRSDDGGFRCAKDAR